MILVVGATGQLGAAVVERLADEGRPVRALVRQGSDHAHLQRPGVELALGDLRDPRSLDLACRGAESVVATANTVIPRARYSFEAIEGTGYAHLVEACARHNVGRFVFISVPTSALDGQIPTARYKRLVEQRLAASGIPFTIFRAAPFMDDWMALLGSTIPYREATAATLARSFWFSGLFMRAVGDLIEKRGLALIPGPGTNRHAFVAVEDVAAFLVRAIEQPEAKDAIFELGGPAILSWDEAVATFAGVLGRPVRSLHVPRRLYRAQQLALAPLSPAASNLMGLNWLLASIDTPYDMTETGRVFGVSLTSLEDFLEERVNAKMPTAA